MKLTFLLKPSHPWSFPYAYKITYLDDTDFVSPDEFDRVIWEWLLIRSERQHNQDHLRRLHYMERWTNSRIYLFLPKRTAFNHSALRHILLLRVHCATKNENVTLSSRHLFWVDSSELGKPIQSSDRTSFEVGRVLLNLSFGGLQELTLF